MVGLSALWLPILLSSVLVFVLSSVIHTVLPWHKSDYPKLPNEDRVMDALRPLAIPPGDYMMPRPSSRQEMRTPQFVEKFKRGPVVMLTVFPGGSMSMGKNLVMWFLYSVVVGCFAACGALADVDLVPPLLAHDDQGDGGRVDLRAPHGGHVRMAVAAIGSCPSSSP